MRGQLSGKPQLLRLHNRTLILSALRRGPLSRADLARQLGLALPTVSRLVDELRNEGLVEEEGRRQSTGGRRAVTLRLRAEAGYVLGAEVGRTGIRIVLTDLAGQVRTRAQRDKGRSHDEDIASLAELAEAALRETGVDRRQLLGIGIGVPGPLDGEGETVLEPPNLQGWSFVPVRRLLRERFGVPVRVENDANAAAYGEFVCMAPDARNLVYVMADAGVGAGLIVEGQLYRGRGGAGEIGHCPVQLGGPRCACGSRGCVEAIASTGAMVAAARRLRARGGPSSLGKDPAAVTFSDLLASEAAGDTVARAVLARGGRALGAGLATLANLLDPELVVLGGEASHSPAYRAAAEAELRRRRFGSGEVRVRVSELGGDAVALGAAVLALHELFESPFATGATGAPGAPTPAEGRHEGEDHRGIHFRR